MSDIDSLTAIHNNVSQFEILSLFIQSILNYQVCLSLYLHLYNSIKLIYASNFKGLWLLFPFLKLQSACSSEDHIYNC